LRFVRSALIGIRHAPAQPVRLRIDRRESSARNIVRIVRELAYDLLGSAVFADPGGFMPIDEPRSGFVCIVGNNTAILSTHGAEHH
jgi:hypothetical protein